MAGARASEVPMNAEEECVSEIELLGSNQAIARLALVIVAVYLLSDIVLFIFVVYDSLDSESKRSSLLGFEWIKLSIQLVLFLIWLVFYLSFFAKRSRKGLSLREDGVFLHSWGLRSRLIPWDKVKHLTVTHADGMPYAAAKIKTESWFLRRFTDLLIDPAQLRMAAASRPEKLEVREDKRATRRSENAYWILWGIVLSEMVAIMILLSISGRMSP